MRATPLCLVGLLMLAGCSAETTDPSPAATAGSAVLAPTEPAGTSATTGQLYPDVIDASATRTAEGTWRFSATLSSPYDSPRRYADAWRVLTTEGTELGVRELAHDHAGEQPFTRSLSGVQVPPEVDEVIIQGRDQVSGWGGATVQVQLNR